VCRVRASNARERRAGRVQTGHENTAVVFDAPAGANDGDTIAFDETIFGAGLAHFE